MRKAPVAAFVCFAVALVGAGQPMAGAGPATASAARGFAYGYKLNVSIWASTALSTVHTRGYGQETCTSTNTPPGCVPSSNAYLMSSPAVGLPLGTNGTVTGSKTGTGHHTIGKVGPANFFSASGIVVETTGTTGSVSSTATVSGINSKTNEEILQADSLQSSCSLDSLGTLTRSTTITDGQVWTDSGQDLNDDGDFDDAGEHGEVIHHFSEGDPTDASPDAGYQPPVDHAIDGHIHLAFEDGDGNPANNWYTETFRYTFNEQLPNPDVIDGTMVVYGAHMKMFGPIARGDLYIGRTGCGSPT